MRQKRVLLVGVTVTLIWLSLSVLMLGTAPRAGVRARLSPKVATTGSTKTGDGVVSTDHHKLCVIVPFRDRFAELMTFTPYLSKFLTAQQLIFSLVVMQQIDGYRFNRASLINAGYFEAKRLDCDYIAMHDVDLLPLTLELRYSYPEHRPVHIASPAYHPRYRYKTFIGGILLISLEHFERVNGMSNRYWGWGMEDDEFYVRLRKANLLPDRPQNLSTSSNNTFLHLHSAFVRPRDLVKLYNQRNVSRKLDRVSGLSNVKFKVQQRSNVTIEGFNMTVVNVILSCDKSFSPWCEFPRPSPSTSPSTAGTSDGKFKGS